MKKKLLLVFPVDKSIVHFNAIAPPLGLGILAALTPPSWDVEIIDENFDTFIYKKADLVGISSWTVNINRAYEIAQICHSNKTPVVMGGPHVSAIPEEALSYCDYVVKGMAEEVWPLFLNDFENGKAEKTYEGVISNMFVKPRHDLFHKDYILGALQTTRGCPLDCDFCHIKQYYGSKYYRKNPDDVVAEMAEIPQKFIFFIDDNLGGFTPKHEKEAILLFDKIINSKIKKYWYSQTSLNIVLNDQFLQKAAESGCGSLLFGFEAETEEALLSINKQLNIKLNPSKYETYINKVQKKGIAVIAATIFGLENDNLESMKKRADFLYKSNAASLTATFLTPFPGTRFFDRLKDQNKLVYNNYPHDWKYYNCTYLTVLPENTEDIKLYEKEVVAVLLKPYKPLSLLRRALVSFWQTKNTIAFLHSYSVNIKYRNFYKRKTNSFYLARLLLTKIFMGNKTTRKK